MFLPIRSKRLGQPPKFDCDHGGLSDLEVRVELLLENPPYKEGQSPDIPLESALRAGKRPKIRIFLREEESQQHV